MNDIKIGSHTGGYTPFSFDVSTFLNKTGAQKLVVRVWDGTDNGFQPRGKQVSKPNGIWYTPVTGIWHHGKMTQEHIFPSSSKYYFGNEWVTVEIIVDGSKSISHVMEGDTILTCSMPQIGGDLLPDNYPVLTGTILESGSIAL